MKVYIGLDDSGRGPLIGPMVLGGVALTLTQNEYLTSIGVKDSKLLSPSARKRLEGEIKNNCLTYKIIKISPEEIDFRLKAQVNLNKLEAIKFASLINDLVNEINAICKGKDHKDREKLEKEKIEKIIIVDCPSNNIIRWRAFLMHYLSNEVRGEIEKRETLLIAKHKAEQHKCVAAASILAKQEREREIAKLKKILNYDFGSGYPADPRTIKFLENYSKFKKLDEKLKFMRKSWATYKKKQTQKTKQKKLKDFLASIPWLI
ncbi:MAG: ribonuclease HII [Candidatus Pacearchaeota archaeon]